MSASKAPVMSRLFGEIPNDATAFAVPGPDQERRRFLAAAATFAAVTLAPGVMLVAAPAAEARMPGTAASSNSRWGILIDVSNCPDGCRACVTACAEENGWGGKNAGGAQWIRAVSVKDTKTGATTSVPVMCQHCESPPCVDVCPTGASFRRDDGIVLVDKHRCIGCRYCMMACPFGARSFVDADVSDQKPHAPRGKGTVESCTLCVHRVDDGREPACVVACNHAGQRSMVFGDLKDPASEIAKAVGRHLVGRLRANLGLGQGILYTGN